MRRPCFGRYCSKLSNCLLFRIKAHLRKAERALMMFRTGKIVPSLRPTDDFFSEANWGQPSSNHVIHPIR